jgi:hypothetical protein
MQTFFDKLVDWVFFTRCGKFTFITGISALVEVPLVYFGGEMYVGALIGSAAIAAVSSVFDRSLDRWI